MIRWQNDFYACMAERWSELEHGEDEAQTPDDPVVQEGNGYFK